MFSSERPSSPGNRPEHPSPPAAEETIRTERLQIERKTFLFALKENPRGRFLRITEDVSGRRDTIIVPAPGLTEFRSVLDQMIQTSDSTPVSPSA